jgi:hypothetical protein
MNAKEALSRLADLLQRGEALKPSRYSAEIAGQLSDLEAALRQSEAVVDHFEAEHGLDCISDSLCDTAKLPRGSAVIEGLVRSVLKHGGNVPPKELAAPGKEAELLTWLSSFKPAPEVDDG